MKLLFAGTPDFAAASLAALLAAGHTVLAVLTQPDRPAGRGMKLQPSPVKALALQHGLPVLQPTSLKTPDIQAELAAYGADMMVVSVGVRTVRRVSSIAPVSSPTSICIMVMPVSASPASIAR